MPYFKNREMMEEMFGEIWTRVIHEFGLGEKLKEAGITLGIKLLDHLIFNDQDYFSLLEKGHL